MEQAEILRLIKNPDLLGEESLPELKKMVDQFPFFQTAWMLLLRNMKNIGSPAFGDCLRMGAPGIANRKILFQYLHPEQFSDIPAKKSRRITESPQGESFEIGTLSGDEQIEQGNTEQSAMIDNFLRKQPVIKIRSSASQENTIDLAEKSVSEHDDFLTETLAEIYVSQKNYKKAIESFEKLGLKFPEKSIYFAGRIQEIKKLLNY